MEYFDYEKVAVEAEGQLKAIWRLERLEWRKTVRDYASRPIFRLCRLDQTERISYPEWKWQTVAPIKGLWSGEKAQAVEDKSEKHSPCGAKSADGWHRTVV